MSDTGSNTKVKPLNSLLKYYRDRTGKSRKQVAACIGPNLSESKLQRLEVDQEPTISEFLLLVRFYGQDPLAIIEKMDVEMKTLATQLKERA